LFFGTLFGKVVIGSCLLDADGKAYVKWCWANDLKVGKKKDLTSGQEWLKFVSQTYMSD